MSKAMKGKGGEGDCELRWAAEGEGASHEHLASSTYPKSPERRGGDGPGSAKRGGGINRFDPRVHLSVQSTEYSASVSASGRLSESHIMAGAAHDRLTHLCGKQDILVYTEIPEQMRCKFFIDAELMSRSLRSLPWPS